MAANAKCAEKNMHRWGVCVQNCAQCNSEDTITVNYCDSAKQYLCYTCNRAARLSVGA